MSTQKRVGIHSFSKFCSNVSKKHLETGDVDHFLLKLSVLITEQNELFKLVKEGGWHWIDSVRVWSSQASLRNQKNHFPRLAQFLMGHIVSPLWFSLISAPTFLLLLAEKLSLSIRAQIMASDLSLCNLSTQQPTAHWLSCSQVPNRGEDQLM